MDLRVDGKRALVTGASSGLGEHFAKVLAEAGASVTLAARRLDKVEANAAALRAAGLDDRRGHANGEGRRQGKAQRAAAVDLADGVEPGLQAVEGRCDVADEVLAGSGECQRGAAPLEQLGADHLLEVEHMAADGALGDAEAFGRAGEAHLPRGSLEGAQRIERQAAAVYRACGHAHRFRAARVIPPLGEGYDGRARLQRVHPQPFPCLQPAPSSTEAERTFGQQ